MNTADHEAAQLLWHHRCAGTTIVGLPEALRPQDAVGGHAIQAQWPTVSAQPLVGWKIAATSAAGQAHINVGGPLPGRILNSFVHAIGDPVSLTGNRMRVVEPEFAFQFGSDLPPRAAPRTGRRLSPHWLRCTRRSRYPIRATPTARSQARRNCWPTTPVAGTSSSAPQRPTAGVTTTCASARVHATVFNAAGGVRFTRTGDGRAALGDPYLALTWLVNELSSRGIALQAGQYVSTGTCMVPLAVAPGDRVSADYGFFGTIDLQLAP